jgi:CRP/FNR family transcriptional regulator, cyclic AMP receptor protein
VPFGVSWPVGNCYRNGRHGLKKVPCAKFLERLTTDSLLKGFVKYLAVRVADQQEVIANLVTIDSEQRLGKTLLHLARQLGKKGPRRQRSS